MISLRQYLLILAFILSIQFLYSSDVIYLNSNKVINGRILDYSNGTLSYRNDDGAIKEVNISDVRRFKIFKSSSNPDNSDDSNNKNSYSLSVFPSYSKYKKMNKGQFKQSIINKYVEIKNAIVYAKYLYMGSNKIKIFALIKEGDRRFRVYFDDIIEDLPLVTGDIIDLSGNISSFSYPMYNKSTLYYNNTNNRRNIKLTVYQDDIAIHLKDYTITKNGNKIKMGNLQ